MPNPLVTLAAPPPRPPVEARRTKITADGLDFFYGPKQALKNVSVAISASIGGRNVPITMG